jgi:protocatechuate 3,4-dioxygenase beta subunit
MAGSPRAPLLAAGVVLALALVAAVLLALGREPARPGGALVDTRADVAAADLRDAPAAPEDAGRSIATAGRVGAREGGHDATASDGLAALESGGAPGPRIAARLVDAGGRPIPAALRGRLDLRPPLDLASMHLSQDAAGSIKTVSLPLATPRAPARTAHCDEDGRVVLELAPGDRAPAADGFVEVRAVADGFEAVTARLQPPPPGSVRNLGEIALAPGRALRGHVVLPAGMEPARARVLLTRGQDAERDGANRALQEIHGPMNHSVLDQVPVDADGAFALDGVSLDARALWAYAPGTTFARADVAAGELDRAGFVLVPVETARAGGCTVEGRVVDPEGAGVSHAWVHVLYADEQNARTTVRSDDQGRFRAGLARSERFTVVALDERFLFGEGRAAAGPCDRDVVVRLPERGRFRVRVVDRAGRALAGATAAVSDPTGRVKWFYGSEALERGVLSVSRPPAPFGLRADAPGYASALVVLDPATLGAEDVVCALELDAAVVGTVTHRGAPVADALVEILSAAPPGRHAATAGASALDRPFDVWCGGVMGTATRTDDAGRFALSRAGAGWRVVRAEADGLGAAITARLELAAGSTPLEVALELPSTGAIAGSVLVRTGQTPAGLLVGACRGDGAVHAAFTDADGRFRIDGLSPGSYQVRHCPPRAADLARGGPMLRIGFSASLAVPGEPVWDCAVAPGRTARFDLDLRDEGAFVLAGITSLAAGGGRAELRRPGVSAGQPLASVAIGDGGAFRCDVSAGGEYELSIQTSIRGVGSVAIVDRVALPRGENGWSYEPPRGDLVVRLPAGTAVPNAMGITHVLRDPRGPVVRTRFGFKLAASAAGKRVRVPAGASTLELTGPGAESTAPRAVHVPADGEVDVVFEGIAGTAGEN